MEKVKVGDLVRRDGTPSCAEMEGVVEDIRANGTISGVRITKTNIHYLEGQYANPAQNDRYQKFYLVSKYPAIKSEFLKGLQL